MFTNIKKLWGQPTSPLPPQLKDLEGQSRFMFEGAVTKLFGEAEQSDAKLKAEKLPIGLKFEEGVPEY
jgi:hypothetical protein